MHQQLGRRRAAPARLDLTLTHRQLRPRQTSEPESPDSPDSPDGGPESPDSPTSSLGSDSEVEAEEEHDVDKQGDGLSVSTPTNVVDDNRSRPTQPLGNLPAPVLVNPASTADSSETPAPQKSVDGDGDAVTGPGAPLSVGADVGIVFGSIIGVALIIILAYWLRKMHREGRLPAKFTSKLALVTGRKPPGGGESSLAVPVWPNDRFVEIRDEKDKTQSQVIDEVIAATYDAERRGPLPEPTFPIPAAHIMADENGSDDGPRKSGIIKWIRNVPSGLQMNQGGRGEWRNTRITAVTAATEQSAAQSTGTYSTERRQWG